MASKLETLKANLEAALGARIVSLTEALGELTLVVKAGDSLAVAKELRDNPSLRFEQLVPGDGLLERITRHLDERRLIGTRLAVGPPYYQGVTVVATVHAFRGVDSDRVRREVHDALYRHLDPLTGGAEGTGWPFGPIVNPSPRGCWPGPRPSMPSQLS